MLRASPIVSPQAAPLASKKPMKFPELCESQIMQNEDGDIEDEMPTFVEETLYLKRKTFTYTRISKPVHFPDYYQTSWLRDVFDYEFQVQFDSKEGTCIDVLQEYKGLDLNKDWNDALFSAALAGIPAQVISPTYGSFLRDLMRVVPVLHRRSPSKLEMLIEIAQKMFIFDPDSFILAYLVMACELLPTGELAKTGNLTYSDSSVWNANLCYSMRLLRWRFPFSCVDIDMRMIRLMEEALLKLSIEEHFDVLAECTFHVPHDMLSLVNWREEKEFMEDSE